jgi:hypothetical protein
MVIGSPLLSLCATRTSGLVKRIMENGASQVGAVSPRAAKGKATAAMTAATAIGLFAR